MRWQLNIPAFILVTELPDNSQAAHDLAHFRLHYRAASYNPYYYCQTCGLYLGTLFNPGRHIR